MKYTIWWEKKIRNIIHYTLTTGTTLYAIANQDRERDESNL